MVTRDEVEDLVARVLSDEVPLVRSLHAGQRMVERGYSIFDVRAVLQAHELESEPAWNAENRNYEVCLIGECLERRITRVVLGLRREGACVLVTVMQVRRMRRDARRRK
jgi:Domain of unknown function (DUF4258)